MSDQGDLFAYARRTDPETSHETAESITDLTERQTATLRMLSAYPPLPDHRLVEVYNWHGVGILLPQSESSIRSRRSELVKQGLVEHTGDYVRTDSGRRARVWAVTEKGREWLRT